MSPKAVTGSAERWGPLWGARPADWALNEDQQVPTYEDALSRVALAPGQLVLDIGCGIGAFLSLVAARSARAFGLDASEALLDLARTRLPNADLRVGDMEALPYDDDTFDLVTGFSSFFFANDIIAALREASRVAKPGAAVVIQVWGSHERNDLEAVKAIIRPYLPPRPADAPAEPDYSRPGVLEDIATKAGLDPESAFDSTWSYEFADEETVRRALARSSGWSASTPESITATIAPPPAAAALAAGATARSTWIASKAHWTGRSGSTAARAAGALAALAQATAKAAVMRAMRRTRRLSAGTPGI